MLFSIFLPPDFFFSNVVSHRRARKLGAGFPLFTRFGRKGLVLLGSQADNPPVPINIPARPAASSFHEGLLPDRDGNYLFFHFFASYQIESKIKIDTKIEQKHKAIMTALSSRARRSRSAV